MQDLTILSSVGRKFMTKRFMAGQDKPVGYDNAKTFNHRTVIAKDLESLHKILVRLEEEPHDFIIRGELIPGVDPNGKVLRRKDANLIGDLPHFQPREGVHWMMLDFDKLPLPDWVPEECRIEYLIDLLPDYLKDVSYHYQWSSSSGVYGWDVISAHVWMWLEEPRSDDELQRWGETVDAIDPALFRTVQVHYTANPIFIGRPDPMLGKRSGLVHKKYPSALIPKLPYVPRWQQCSVQHTSNGVSLSQGGFEYHLNSIGVRLHMPIQKSICAWIAATNANSDLNRLKDRLRGKISQSSHADLLHYLSDVYLDQCISSALTKIQPAANGPDFVPETQFEKLRAKLKRKMVMPPAFQSPKKFN